MSGIRDEWTTEDGSVRLLLGDCLEILPGLGKVDACVTDPPWGVSNDNANAKRSRGFRPYDTNCRARDFAPVIGDDSPFDPTPLLAFPRLVLWGANHFSERLPSSSFWLVWDRKAGKAADSDITDCELAWTSGTEYRTVRIFRHMWAGFQRDSQAGQQHLHPMEKPIELMSWSIGWFKKAQTILDPFMGSGTTGVACIRLGRKFVGIEREPKYFEIAKKRIRDELDKTALIEKPKRLVQTSFVEATL